MESLVSTAWLAEALAGGAPPVVLDASHHLADPASGVRRDAEAEYRAGHIPGAGEPGGGL